MKCKDVLRQLEAFRCGELDERTASSVRSHLQVCGDCARALEALGSEDEIYRAYSDELERNLTVSPDAWKQVCRRIELPAAARRRHSSAARLSGIFRSLAPRPAALRQAVLVASIVLVSVGATLLTMRFYRAHDIENRRPVVGDLAKGSDSQDSLETALRSIQRAERDYNDAIAVLSKIVDRRKPSLDPLVVAEVEKNLRAIDESIAATRAAYHNHPSDPDLAQYMLTAYEKKVELLLELAS